MGDESGFRLIYTGRDAGTVLCGMDVSEISYNGMRLDHVTNVEFHANSDGLPRLVLTMTVENIEIGGPAEIEIVTE